MPAPVWLWLGALAGYALMMWTNPAHRAFRDGLRAVRRYRMLWLVLGGLGCAHAVFELTMRVYLSAVLPESDRPVFMWAREAWRDPQFWLTGSSQSVWWLPQADLREAMRASVLPSVESLAGLFHCLIGTFPISAIAAALLFINWRGYQGTLLRALRKRFGFTGWAVHALLLVCALAAVVKPALFAGPRVLPYDLWLQWGPVVAWLSSIFEYFFGVCLQVYLILLAYAWVRGLSFARGDLLDVAIRRFSFVVKWSALILLLSSIVIDAPLILKNFAPFTRYFPEEGLFAMRLAVARVGLALFVLLGASVQIAMTLHSESWRKAWRGHFTFLARCWWLFGWFVIIAIMHFFAIAAGIEAVARGVGEGTALWTVWKLVSPWLAGGVAAWLLASWVCVFKQCEVAPALTPAQVRF